MKVITREVKKIENFIDSISENIIGILEIEKDDSPEMIEHVKEIIESRVGKRKEEVMNNEAFVEIPSCGRKFRMRDYDGQIDLVEFKNNEIHLIWLEPKRKKVIFKEDTKQMPLFDYENLFMNWINEARNSDIEANDFFEKKLEEYKIEGQLRESFLFQLRKFIEKGIF